MKDLKVTLAALKSLVIDKQRNLERVEHACSVAAEQGARMVVMPELMLSGHAGHPMMVENAEEVPDVPQAQAVLELSRMQDVDLILAVELRAEGREVNHGASRNRRSSTVLLLLDDAAIEAP